MKLSYCRLMFLFIIFSVLSCSTYSIKTDIEENSILKKIKKTGIIFRIPHSSKITKEESINNFLTWLSIYQKKENVIAITEASESLIYFKDPQLRFYQLSNENEFLKYKSIGVLNRYLQNNQNELLNIISNNNLDSLTIFEVYSVISTQMQFFEFESVLAVVDSSLNIAYLDHQSNYYESESSVLGELKNQMLDVINNRLVNHLYDINLLGKKDGRTKNINKKETRTKEKIPVAKTTEKEIDKDSTKDFLKKEKTENKPAEVKDTLKDETKTDKISVDESKNEK